MIHFDTPDALCEFLDVRDDHDHMPLAPEQRDITFGSAVVEFVDIDRHIIRFGTVRTLAQVGSMARAAGGKDVEAGTAIGTARLTAAAGLLPVLMFSRLNTDGVLEMVHKAHVWPVYPHTFTMAERRGFDPRNFETDAAGILTKIEVQAAFAALKKHTLALTERPARRPYEEFEREVWAIAHRATAHNHGQAVWGKHRTGDRELVVRMSSWPRGQEAIKALTAAGYSARSLAFNGDGVAVRDRSEEPFGGDEA